MILITASYADAMPEGAIIKDGILIYPARHYLTEDPVLLGLENYGDAYEIKTSGGSPETFSSGKGCMCFVYMGENTIPWTLDAGSLCICPSNILSIYYCRNMEMLHPGFAFLCCSTSPSFYPMALSDPLNAASFQEF